MCKHHVARATSRAHDELAPHSQNYHTATSSSTLVITRTGSVYVERLRMDVVSFADRVRCVITYMLYLVCMCMHMCMCMCMCDTRDTRPSRWPHRVGGPVPGLRGSGGSDDKTDEMRISGQRTWK